MPRQTLSQLKQSEPVDPINEKEAKELAIKALERRIRAIKNAKDRWELINAINDAKLDYDVIGYARDVIVRVALREGWRLDRIAWLTDLPRASIQRFSNRGKYTYSETKSRKNDETLNRE